MRKLLSSLLIVTALLWAQPGRAQRTAVSALPNAGTPTTIDLLLIDVDAGGGTYSTRKITITNLVQAAAITNFLGTRALVLVTSNALVKNLGGVATNFSISGPVLQVGSGYNQYWSANQEVNSVYRGGMTNGITGQGIDSPGTATNATGPFAITYGMVGHPVFASQAGAGGIYSGPDNDFKATAFVSTSGSSGVTTNWPVPWYVSQEGLWNGQAWNSYGVLAVDTNGNFRVFGRSAGLHWGPEFFRVHNTLGVQKLVTVSPGVFTGPGTIAINASGVVTGSSTTFQDTFKTNRVFYVGGQRYLVTGVSSQTSCTVDIGVTQSAGTTYDVYTDALTAFDVSGRDARYGLHYTGTGELIVSAAALPSFHLVSGVRDWRHYDDGTSYNLAAYVSGNFTLPVSIDYRGTGGLTINSAGDLTTAGNLTATTAGKGLVIKTGSNARAGRTTLTANPTAVANTSVTANTKVFLTGVGTDSTAPGRYTATTTAGVGFNIYSSAGGDTATVDWLLVEGN